MAKESIIVSIDWTTMHDACAQLDSVREGIGHDGICDPFGGSYAPYLYEDKGLSGLVSIHTALRMITHHAWKIIHSASDDVRAANVRRTEDGYYQSTAPLRGDDGQPVIDEDGQPVYTTVRRWSRKVAARKVAERVARQIRRAQAATRVMLAARPVYDALMAAGIVTIPADQSILAGHGDDRINATGLLWLAGARAEAQSATIAQAQAFAERGLDALRELTV